MLTGSTSAKEKKRIKERIASDLKVQVLSVDGKPSGIMTVPINAVKSHLAKELNPIEIKGLLAPTKEISKMLQGKDVDLTKT